MDYICSDCPRKCNVLRNEDRVSGFCRSYSLPTVVRAAPHYGEEPCISGTRGSGAIFFSGCNLKCAFCQNHEISRSGAVGKTVSVSELQEIMLRLRDTGVHNINLVTGVHYSRVIAEALDGIQLGIPVVWNSSGYESVETLKLLEGLVSVYMPDMKYFKSRLSQDYSSAPDYPEVAAAAIKEMYRQVGSYKLNDDGLLTSGVLIRHLILPQQELNTMDVIDFVADEFPPDSVLFSLMAQYTPLQNIDDNEQKFFDRFPELSSTVTAETNSNLYSYMVKRGITSGYWQETAAATDEMVPLFDGTGTEVQVDTVHLQ